MKYQGSRAKIRTALARTSRIDIALLWWRFERTNLKIHPTPLKLLTLRSVVSGRPSGHVLKIPWQDPDESVKGRVTLPSEDFQDGPRPSQLVSNGSPLRRARAWLPHAEHQAAPPAYFKL